jgi:inhibitor of KinA
VESFKLSPLGDVALVVDLGHSIDLQTHRRVKALYTYFAEHALPGLIECVPAFTTLTIFYDPVQFAVSYKDSLHSSNLESVTPYERICSLIEQLIAQVDDVVFAAHAERIIEIPVCYDRDFGPDLNVVAEHNNLTPEEVIKIHSGAEYQVYMIGFAPGFPYLGGMPSQIATPRRTRPRLAVPAGTIGIGGAQTGIYSIETPGGWQLIGRTPVRLFRPFENPPSFLRMGDGVRFREISRAEFDAVLERLQ